MNFETKSCQNCNTNFIIAPEDFAFYERIKVPPPTLCWKCRLQRRLAFRNVRSLYKDECDLCGKKTFSMYSPEKPYKVFCKDCWYGDGWDAMDYGRDYDPNRSFFEQFIELQKAVPRIALFQIRNTVNSEFANFTIGGRNLYLSYSALENEYVYYSYYIDKSRECFDCFNVMECENCYECVDCSRCYKTLFSYKAHDCIDSVYLFDCVNCQDCFMSVNLRNKRYVFRNQQMSKEEYQKAVAGLPIGSLELQEEFSKITQGAIHRFSYMIKATNCTGDNIENAKNAKYCFDFYYGENVKYGVRCVKTTKDSYDVFGAGSELLYEGVASGYGSFNCKFYTYLDAVRDAEYVDWCMNSANLFGCVGLRKKEYCILNRQYSPGEYAELTPKIKSQMSKIGEYGEFFPASMSPWAYNETMAQEHYPLSQEAIIAKGLRWREADPYLHKPTIRAAELPDLASASDAVCNEIIGCSSCDKVYRIIKAELDFLKRFKINLPTQCLDCRFKRRFETRNPYDLWPRQCYKCDNRFETSYAPSRPEKIYCETCYQREIL